MTCYFCNFCYFQNFLELNFRWLFWSKATVFLCFFLLLGDLFLAHFSFFLHFFECLVLSDICCVFLELLLISTDFTHYSVVVRFGPIMEFFLRLLPLSSIFGEMFYIFLGGFFRKLCWTFLGHFCTFLECFILFFNFLGPFLVCRSFLAIFATFFWPNSITFSFLFSPFFSRSFRHFLISFLHFFNTILHLWCIFFSTFWHHLKPFDTFLAPIANNFE